MHEKAFIVDTHNDVLLRSMIGRDILSDLPESHSGFPKIQASGIDCQVFSIWVSPFEFKEGEYFDRANDMITQLEYLCSTLLDTCVIPMNYQDYVYNEQKLKSSPDSLANSYDPDSDLYWYKENEFLEPYLHPIVPDIESVSYTHLTLPTIYSV